MVLNLITAMIICTISVGSRLVASKGLDGGPRKLYILSALTQAEKPLPKRQRKLKRPTIMKRWMLIQVTQQDPQGKLHSLIESQQWDNALELAQQHQLSPDDIYK